MTIRSDFVISIMLLMIFTGCVHTMDMDNLDSPYKIAVLHAPGENVYEGMTDAIGAALERGSFEITFLTVADVCDPEILTPEKYFLYVIPGYIEYPEKGAKALTEFIQAKGNLMIIGQPQLPGQPLLETLSPAYKLYAMHDLVSLKIREDQGIINPDKIIELPAPEKAFSCFRRPTGKGFECGYTYRWIPVLSGHDEEGLERGTAAWMLINQEPFLQDSTFKDALRRLIATTQGNEAKQQMDVEGVVYAVCAVDDPEVLKKLAATPLFGKMASRIAKGVYLSYGGSKEFSYWPGESMVFGAAVVNYGRRTEQTNVSIRVTENTSRKVVFEEKKHYNLKPGESISQTFGEMAASAESGGYVINVELESNNEVIDVIRHGVGILSDKEEPDDAFITVDGTDFLLNGKKWNPVGVNYWPRSAIATEQVDYLYHWLRPGYYDPDQVEDDLRRLQHWGINFVAVRANYLSDRRTVLDFIRRCRNHDIYVYLFLQRNEVTAEPHYFEGIMMPFMFQKDLVADFISETRISSNPGLFAWDLIWEPSNWLFKDDVTMFGWNGNPNFRQRWDQDWAEWIDERYGSLADAEKDWGIQVPRSGDNRITSPASLQFETDGPWRIMVAAYRRFMGDLMNRYHNDAYRTLRELDPNHLITYRQGNLPPTDYTLTSTLKHVDFFSMEAYSFPPKENGLNKVGFVNRYLSHALKDKPFIWNEYGYGGPWGKHTRHLDGEDIAYQFEYVDMVNGEAYRNGANGIAPWWFPGGLRASEKTDFGITSPEGTLRPAGTSLKKYGELYRHDPPERPVPDTWFTIDPDAHSGGLWYIVNGPGANAYRNTARAGKILGVKTQATGSNSANVPLRAVGNTHYNGKNPPKYLNAEFNWFRIRDINGEWINVLNGDTVSIKKGFPVKIMASVGNTQEAEWLTPVQVSGKRGAVFLASTGRSEIRIRQAINEPVPWNHDSDFGGIFELTEGISAETFVELQMVSEGRAWFGEKYRFTLIPEPGQ